MNKKAVDISHLSTFGLLSSTDTVIRVDSKILLQKTIQTLQIKGTAFVIVGGGSNSLFAPVVDKVLVVIEIPGIAYVDNEVTAGAGVLWDELVIDTIAKGYSGLEALSAIPGNVGAAPIQNIGAYGTEVAACITTVEAYDIATDSFVVFTNEQCGFGYRTSNFKTVWVGKYIVIAVTFALSKNSVVEVSYPGVAAALPANQPITPAIVRDTIIAIRWSKLPKPEILPNLGSFFHNPAVPALLAENLLKTFPTMPVFPAEQEGMKKLSAGWLIEQCGWKGKRQGTVGMYEKNALVMVNYGGATLSDVLDLQKTIQENVQEKFGVMLTREPAIID